MNREYEVRSPWSAVADCPPGLTFEECRELGRLHADLSDGQMRPSDADGSWALICRNCGTAEIELGMVEALALEGLQGQLGPCCVDPDRTAEPLVYVRQSPPVCPRCGLSIAHYHPCRWSPE